MSTLLHEILGAMLLLVLFLSVIGLAEFATRRGWLPAEPARKSIHLAGGLGCLLFPFLITSWVTVLFLAVVLAVTLHYGEQGGMLRSLASVARKSYGSLLFPLAILFLFVVSNGRIWLYVSSLLVLVLADTAAALAGTRFGVNCYETFQGQQKSLEGTVVFALVGFFSVYLALLALSAFPPLTCILTALLMAILLAGLEAVSIGGTDNLFVPIGTCFLLLKIPSHPQPEILFQCISFVAVASLVFVMNWHSKTFRTRPLIIFILASYATWSLGSFEWMLPLVVCFFLYNWICTPCERLPTDLTARRLLRPLYPPLIILFLANTHWAFDFWFAPFIVATAATTSLCIESRFRREYEMQFLQGQRLWATLLFPPLLSLLVCLPAQGIEVFVIAPFVVALCVIAALSYRFSKPSSSEGFPWNYSITFHAGSAALIYAGLQYLGIVQPLTPLKWVEVFR